MKKNFYPVEARLNDLARAGKPADPSKVAKAARAQGDLLVAVRERMKQEVGELK
jgi:hypothetical protein